MQGGSSSISLVRQAMGLVGQSSEPNRLEAWAHYTVVYDGGEASFYLDGVPTGSGADRTIGTGSSSVLTLGNHEDGTDPLNGRLADVVIWNEARTAEEVADFVSGAAAPADLGGLVGHWPMDEGSGSEARDASGHGHDATVEGAAGRWTASTGAGVAVRPPPSAGRAGWCALGVCAHRRDLRGGPLRCSGGSAWSG